MLKVAGAASIAELFEDQVPANLLFQESFGLPPALSEPEIQRELGALAASNRSTGQVVSFLGGGISDHFIPAAVGMVANRSEFLTAYTPYQPEASQGTLQAFFEYQTLVCRLFGMDVSNASLYDGASALGEALFLALGAKPDATSVLLPATLHPDYRALVGTYLKHFGIRIDVVPMRDGVTDVDAMREMAGPDTAAVVVQHPNYFGCLEDAGEFSRIARRAGALLVAVCDPLSLGVLGPPGTYGADIAVGEGQSLGLRQWCGGETLGIFTCKKEFTRRIPGRLVGIAHDRCDRRGYVLTLQTREQHIRREKATSNICTNHAHNALRATIHLSLMGARGLAWASRRCVRNLHRFRTAIRALKPQADAFGAPCFKEMTVRLREPAEKACAELVSKGFYAGVPAGPAWPDFENLLLVCVTEQRTDDEIDRFAKVLGDYL
jgi:glycine dehydrogenase subunit 1